MTVFRKALQCEFSCESLRRLSGCWTSTDSRKGQSDFNRHWQECKHAWNVLKHIIIPLRTPDLHSLLHSCFCLELCGRRRTEPRIQRKTKRQIWRHNRIAAVLCSREEMWMLPRCGTARHATFVMLLGDEHHPLLFNRVGAEREMNLDTCFPPAMYYLTQRTEYFFNFNPVCYVPSKVA